MSDLVTDIWTQFDTKTEEKWKRLVKKLQQSCTGLQISEAERNEIVKAMGLRSGHWYKCPRGHVYAIGDCGGAVTVSLCFGYLFFFLENYQLSFLFNFNGR